MNNPECQRYLEDPEAHAAHLARCEECRALFTELDRDVPAEGVRFDALPLAPWEGAAHRPWPLILIIAIGVLLSAAGLFAMAGTSPVGGFVSAIRSNIPSADLMASMLKLAGGAAQNAPATWQIGVVVAFVIVNVILLRLLRRAPKGLDV